jgi:hypothetical protein
MKLFCMIPSLYYCVRHIDNTCINWWSCFTDHRYVDIKLKMWTHVRNMVLDRPTSRHCWDCYFCMCHQLVSSGTPARSLYLRLPLFLTMCSCALWNYQTLLHNWVVIKVAFGCMTMHGMGCEQIKMEFAPPREHERYLQVPQVRWIWKCMSMPIWLKG